jgi:hypothetical protein
VVKGANGTEIIVIEYFLFPHQLLAVASMTKTRTRWTRHIAHTFTMATTIMMLMESQTKTSVFRVCGSAHLQIFNKTTNQIHNQFKIYCFVAYTPLNMFRALLCPSSGAPSNCLCSHWLPYDVLARPTRQSYGNHWLQRQLEGAPDDGHNSARNML